MYQVTRIMEVEINSPYDVLGVNHNMSDGNIKKKYVFLYLFILLSKEITVSGIIF